MDDSELKENKLEKNYRSAFGMEDVSFGESSFSGLLKEFKSLDYGHLIPRGLYSNILSVFLCFFL